MPAIGVEELIPFLAPLGGNEPGDLMIQHQQRGERILPALFGMNAARACQDDVRRYQRQKFIDPRRGRLDPSQTRRETAEVMHAQATMNEQHFSVLQRFSKLVLIAAEAAFDLAREIGHASDRRIEDLRRDMIELWGVRVVLDVEAHRKGLSLLM